MKSKHPKFKPVFVGTLRAVGIHAMMSLEQFSWLVITRSAMEFAIPKNGCQGPNFTWKDSFPKMSVSWVKTQWTMANRSMKSFYKQIHLVEKIANEVAQQFSEITGKP